MTPIGVSPAAARGQTHLAHWTLRSGRTDLGERPALVDGNTRGQQVLALGVGAQGALTSALDELARGCTGAGTGDVAQAHPASGTLGLLLRLLLGIGLSPADHGHRICSVGVFHDEPGKAGHRSLVAAWIANWSVGLRTCQDGEAGFPPGRQPAVEVGDLGVTQVLQRGGGKRGAATGCVVENSSPVGIELGTVVGTRGVGGELEHPAWGGHGPGDNTVLLLFLGFTGSTPD